MTAKQTILTRLRAVTPPPRPLPDLPSRSAPPEELLARFRSVLKLSKTITSAPAAPPNIAEYYPEAKIIASTVPYLPGNVALADVKDPLELARVDLAVLEAKLGVAENGAMWVAEPEEHHRVLPFIAQHLLLVLDPEKIVPTMHEAYRRIEIDATGFGVFVAGPSKTADIEQSLVIGAHGPRSLTVVLANFNTFR